MYFYEFKTEQFNFLENRTHYIKLHKLYKLKRIKKILLVVIKNLFIVIF